MYLVSWSWAAVRLNPGHPTSFRIYDHYRFGKQTLARCGRIEPCKKLEVWYCIYIDKVGSDSSCVFTPNLKMIVGNPERWRAGSWKSTTTAAQQHCKRFPCSSKHSKTCSNNINNANWISWDKQTRYFKNRFTEICLIKKRIFSSAVKKHTFKIARFWQIFDVKI